MASILSHVARLFFQNILPKHLVNKHCELPEGCAGVHAFQGLCVWSSYSDFSNENYGKGLQNQTPSKILTEASTPVHFCETVR